MDEEQMDWMSTALAMDYDDVIARKDAIEKYFDRSQELPPEVGQDTVYAFIYGFNQGCKWMKAKTAELDKELEAE